jgi:Domain of unknown function DUF29
MPDSRTLYDEDFIAWTEQQAEALRTAAKAGSNLAVDWENLAEEVEDLGRALRHELRSRLTVILCHLIKLEHSAAADPRRGWRSSIREARSEVESLLTENPSLRRDLPRLIAEQLPRSVKLAVADLDDYHELDSARRRLAQGSSYTHEQILGDWFPPEPMP